MTVRRASVLTHRREEETRAELLALREAARDRGVTLCFDRAEAGKHGVAAGPGVEVVDALPGDVDLCLVLGGDGTILTGLRAYTGTAVPVYAVNYGEVGFLATVDPDPSPAAYARAFAGDFEHLALPAVAVGHGDAEWTAINDASVHRQPGLRVADLAYKVGGEEVGRVRCDGLVIATPAGSTGYNLANGGPVLAWGVSGYVVSFISPHSLAARALVVAPEDVLTVQNVSRDEPVDVHVDGRPVRSLAAGEELHVRFAPEAAVLAQLTGATFYHRLRERFGRLAR